MPFLRSAGGFLAGFVLAAAATIAVLGAGHRGSGADESAAESLATATYLLVVTSLPPAAGFAAVTCGSKRWRELAPRAAVAIAAACGFLCYAAELTGLAGLSAVVAPFPLGAIGAAIRLVVPGVVLGLLALAASTFVGRRRHISHS